MTVLSQTTPGGGGFVSGAAEGCAGQAGRMVRMSLELFGRVCRCQKRGTEELSPRPAAGGKSLQSVSVRGTGDEGKGRSGL